LARRNGRGSNLLHLTTGASRSEVRISACFYEKGEIVNTSDGSYLHINGFIHRDVKAANLLIDDDGTVLLGDLGVAADLSEESSRYTASSEKSASDSAALNQTQTPRMVTFQPRLVLNKRKSFVGTVCICLVFWGTEVLTTYQALLDGA